MVPSAPEVEVDFAFWFDRVPVAPPQPPAASTNENSQDDAVDAIEVDDTIDGNVVPGCTVDGEDDEPHHFIVKLHARYYLGYTSRK